MTTDWFHFLKPQPIQDRDDKIIFPYHFMIEKVCNDILEDHNF